MKLARERPAAFLDAYSAYARRATAAVAGSARLFQVWNEANTPIDALPSSLDTQVFLAGAAAVRSVKPDARVIVNLLAALTSPGWSLHLRRWLREAGPQIDVLGLDCYPGTWSPGDGSAFKAIDVATRLLRAHDPTGRIALAIAETGYATWGRALPAFLPTGHREADQARWYARALPALQRQLAAVRTSGIPVEFVNLYELADADTGAGVNPEHHFGILRSDLSEKPAAGAVRAALKTSER